jgi:pyrroline-5-carboxylate reductase
MRVTFIGGGNMAGAIIAGLAKQGDANLQLHVVDRNLDKCERFAKDHGATFSLTISEADLAADVVVLAIKPQQLKDLATQITPWLSQQLIVSVAAGVRTAKLASWLGGYDRLVWVMPNTPAQISAGISGMYATPKVADGERAVAERLFKAVGEVVWLAEEEQMDRLTAITGCGPAYVFYMVEALTESARVLGFDDETARRMAQGTFAGAIRLLESSGEKAEDLRAKVTSKKGVTEQGIFSFMEDDLFALFRRATERARARLVEMGDML